MSTGEKGYRGPRLRVRAIKQVCPTCNKTAWFHKRMQKRWVCRGDLTPSMTDEGKRPVSGWVGCGREL